jgi:hypothetical protein
MVYMYHADHEATIFEDSEDFKELEKQGWVDTPAKIVAAPIVDRAALKQEATDLGIAFHASIKTDKLMELINDCKTNS